MPGADIEIRPSAGNLVVALSGELDATASQAVTECVRAVTADVGTVVLDLGGVTFIDSSGIAALVALHRELSLALRRLELTNVHGHVRHVLELTGATRLLDGAG